MARQQDRRAHGLILARVNEWIVAWLGLVRSFLGSGSHRRPEWNPRAKRLIGLFGAVVLLGGLLPIGIAFGASGTVTGKVFKDFNSNGTQDPANTTTGLLADPGMAGITVTAYDSTGAAVGTTTTGSNGSYSLPVMNSTGDDLRIEFTNWPAGYYSSWKGAQNGTSVQFVKLSQSPVANFALVQPEDYCQDNPQLAYGCQRFGDPVKGANKDELSMLLTPYSAGNHIETDAVNKVIAKFKDTGSVWGVTIPRTPASVAKEVYTAAYYRTSSGLGPNGTGAIYKSATTGSLPNTTLFADLNQIFGPTTAGVDARTGFATNTGRTLATAGDWADDHSWDKVGKTGLGGLTSDEKNVYVVNLADRKLYTLPLADPTKGTATQIPINLPAAQQTCPNDDTRPFAATYRGGKVYVGITCTGQSNQSTSALRSYVYTYDVDTKTWSNKPVYEQKLERPKEAIVSDFRTGHDPTHGTWHPWPNTDPYDLTRAMGVSAQMAYAIPQFTGITFDGDDMILGYRDLYGDMMPANNPGVDSLASGGDIVRACLVNGTYQLENNATCGSRTGYGANNKQGPGGGEFYEDNYPAWHRETLHGGVWQVPGRDSVASTVMDPISTFTGGVVFNNNTTGQRNDSKKWQAYPDRWWDTFRKSNGMTDIEALCDQAPLEIGNYVWIDDDKDGIQDPNEKPVPGVTVNLYDKAGNKIATQITDGKGEYYFNDRNVPGGLNRQDKYTIRLDNPADYASGGPLFGYTLTIPEAGPKRTIDSNGKMVAGAGGTFPTADVTTGKSGQNDHTFDFGFNLGKEEGKITKRDKETGQEADTEQTGIAFNPGETRVIEMPVENTGSVDLVEIQISDKTLAGNAKVTEFQCLFPGDSTPTMADANGVIKWAATFATPPTRKWKPGEKFTCTSKLTLPAGAPLHTDSVYLDGKADGSGKPIHDENKYNAYVAGIDIVKFDGRDASKVPANPVDGPDKKDGVYGGATPGGWDAAIDADTEANAVQYPLNGATTGPQKVRAIVTNTGKTDLMNVTVDDQTKQPPAIQGWTCTFPDGSKGLTWVGPFKVGTSFPCEGTVELKPGDKHYDIAGVTADVVDPGTGKPNGKKVDDEDPYWAKVPDKDEPIITKRDQATGKEADTADDPMVIKPGETISIEMPVANKGASDLVEVFISDKTIAGDAKVTDLQCMFPGDAGPTKADANNVVKWAATYGNPATRKWKAGETFTCTAKLTLPAGAKPHENKVRVDAKVDGSGKPVYNENNFNAKVPAIDIVKYDGRDASKVPANHVDGPDKKDGVYSGPTPGSWDAKVDADTEPNAVVYSLNGATTGPQPVRAIVTNTGELDLTNIVVDDLTKLQPDVKGWVCTFPDGTKGLTWSGLFKVGAKFPCEGTVDLKPGDKHHDIAGVIGDAVDPKTGQPTGKKVDDEDPYWAIVNKDDVDITKRDQATGKEADTADDPMVVKPGETITIEMPVTNTGQTDLVEVSISDKTIAGDAKVTDLQCTFPGDALPTKANANNVVQWAQTFVSPASRKWKPGEKFICTAKLTLPADAKPHTDKVRVDAKVDGTGKPVTDENDFNAKVPAIDIVKYDGRSQKPATHVDGPDKKDGVYSGPTPGSWDAKVDADTEPNAVVYSLNGATTGPQKVSAIITNTGQLDLTNVVVDDLTKQQPDVKGWVCTFPDGTKGLTWSGLFKVGAWFSCEGTLDMKFGDKHHDIAGVTGDAVDPKTGQTTGKKVDDEDPYWAIVKKDDTEILKRDQATGNEADTADAAHVIKPGETITIEMPVTNKGESDLVEVFISDKTIAGDAKVTDLQCTFPGNATPTKADASNVVKWSETYGNPPSRKWKPGEKFTCTAKLTLPADAKPHQDKVRVDAKVDGSGKPVFNENDFHAKVPAIDIVKFDARDAAKIPANPVDGPDKKDGNYGGATNGSWDAKVDADTEPNAVVYPLNGATTGPQKVQAIVTNTGQLDLTNVVVDDLTKLQPPVQNWVCTFPDGTKGLTWPGLFKVGAKFTCEGTLELKPGEKHHNISGVTADAVDPKTGKPTDKKVDDEDPFWARVIDKDEPEILKRDKDTGKEADSANDPMVLKPGETITIEMPVTNKGSSDLVEVAISDKTIAGDAKVTNFQCLFPGDAQPTKADASNVVKWAATFGTPPSRKWKAGEKFTCTATLTLPADAKPHQDRVRVDAKVDGTGKPVFNENDFHAKVPAIDIVKFDGRDASKIQANAVDGPDKKDGVFGGATNGTWDPKVDADTEANGVVYTLNGATTGPQKVHAIVTNTGQLDLANVVIDDLTKAGPDVKSWVCTFPDGTKGLTWPGLFKVGSSFRCEGVLEMKAGETHHDIGGVTADPVDKDGKPTGKKVDDEDPYHAKVVKDETEITKRDQATGNEADTELAAHVIKPGETITIEMPVANKGTSDLVEVAITDRTFAGDAKVTDFKCLFPGDAAPTAAKTQADGSQTVTWAQTFGNPAARKWKAGEKFTCTAKLTLPAGAKPHGDKVRVDAKVDGTGKPIFNENNFHSKVGGIDIQKYDEALGKPEPYDPSKINADQSRDADTAGNAVKYAPGQPRKIYFAVKNTGEEALKDVKVGDKRTGGVGDVTGLTCDFSKLGGPSSGTTWAGPFKPGDWFFCTGMLSLPAGANHADTATVEGTGTETGKKYDSSDPFHAKTDPPKPPPIIPITGSNITTMVLIGLGLIGGGALLLMRKPRSWFGRLTRQ